MASFRGRRVRQLSIMGVAALFVLVLTFAGASVAEERINPHDFSNRKLCGYCHANVPSLKHDPVSTCTKCHMGNVANHPVSKHPIGIVPVKARLSEPMQLSKEGTLVCYTCHNHHGKKSFSHMLRVDMGRVCTACHKGH